MRVLHKQTDKLGQVKNWRKKVLNISLLVGFGLSLFLLGWAGGSGRLSLPGRQLASENKTLPKNLDYASVEQVYDVLRQSYDGKLDVDTLLDGLKQGLASAADDPYTEYFNKEQAKEFDDELNGTFSGIGAELSKEEEAIVVVAPISGYPAEKAGLRPKDIIAEINNEPTFGMTLTEAVQKIRGPAGSEVKLTIVRGEEGQKEYVIIREDITIPSVEFEMKENNTGYIQISRFGDDSLQLTADAAQSLKSQGARSIVLDLRGNPGGRLDAAVEIADLWIGKSKVILEEKRGGVTIKTYKARGNNDVLSGMPTVALINEGSASASEIVAGALKDNGVATLIGTTSFGKGSVQGLETIKSGGILKVTIARWYTPSGKNIDHEGITPDQTVALSSEQAASGEDPQLQAALAFLKNR